LERVIDPDDRQEVRAEEIARYAPWSWICSLEGYLKGDPEPKFCGTGWLVGPCEVVTAGHCLYSPDGLGQRFERIRVIPGRSGSDCVSGEQVAESFRSGWEIFGTEIMADRSHDFGMVRLPRPFAKVEGHFPLRTVERPGEMVGQWINVAGYPALHATLPSLGQHLLWHGESVREAADPFLRYGADTSEGQSGAPVFLARPEAGSAEDRLLPVAIHLNYAPDGEGTLNQGLVLTEAVREAMRSWFRSEAPQRPRRGPFLSWRRGMGKNLHG
jgi:V8-like Glu-specific endopeptidase